MFEQIIDEVDNTVANLSHFMAYARQRKINAAALDAKRVLTDVTRVIRAEFDSAGYSQRTKKGSPDHRATL